MAPPRRGVEPARPPALAPPPSLPKARRTTRSVEDLLGANWLARAGMLVLALGVVFFLKLAYDRNWVPLAGRFAIGLVGGLALFGLGETLRRRTQPAFSQVLSGGGAVLSYVTIYLAWVFPDYRATLHLSLAVEVGLLAAVSALLAAYAIWRDLPILAGVAVALSSILLAPAGDFSTVGLLYVAFLNAGILVAAAWRNWSVVVLTATLAADSAHLLAFANGAPWGLVAASATVVNVLAQVAAHRMRDDMPGQTVRHVIGASGPALLFILLGLALGPTGAALLHPWGWAAILVSAAALAGAAASHRLAPSLGVAGAVLLLLWPLLQFPDSLWQVLAYAGLAASALGLGSAMPRSVRPAGTVSGAAAAIGTMCLFWQALTLDAVQANPWACGGLSLLLVAVGAAQWTLGRREADARPGGAQTSYAGLAAAAALVLAWPFLQFEHSLWQTFSLAVAASALTAVALAGGRQGSTVRAVAAGAALVGVLSLVLLATIDRAVDAQPWGTGGLALLLAAAGVAAWASSSRSRSTEDDVSAGAGLAVVGFLVLVWPFLQFRGSLWQTFTLALAGGALLGAGLAWPRGRRIAHALAAGAGGVAIGSLFVLASDARAIALHPLGAGGVTTLAAGLGVGLWLAARRRADALLRPAALGIAAAVPVVYLGFLLDGWQVAVAWAVEGLALASLGLGIRDVEVRAGSFALFALVLGRIFLIDFRRLDLPLRVLTFVFTGALLLLAAYLFARQRKGATEPGIPEAGRGG